MLNGKLPAKDTLVTFLTVCGVGDAELLRWLAAWQRISDGDVRQPAGAVRVCEASPRELGVHAAIQARGAVGELPMYVPRDVDAGLREAVSAGTNQGCFLLLVGSSSVGKTRSAYEAVLACVPDWWLVHPADAEQVRAVAAAARPAVVWLDELQRYLGDQGVTAETVRALRRAGAIVVATLWPEEYLIRTTPRRPGSEDPCQTDRELLDMAQVFDVAEVLSDIEQREATALAATDVCIRAALGTADAGLIQVLAAGPALVRWWDQSPDPYAKAVITAAADARRMGVEMPLPREFLADAVRGYLTPRQRAMARPGWLDVAVTYALTPLQGAAATLTPVPTDDGVLGRVAGYRIADYLLQHARRSRRAVCPPPACWQALLDHTFGCEKIRRLARAARVRMRYQYAEVLYRRLADDGDADAADTLAGLLVQQGRTDEAIAVLRPAAEAGVAFAMDRLVDLLLAQDRVDDAVAVLWPPDDDRRWCGATRLAEILVGLGRADEAVAALRMRADIGDQNAGFEVDNLLAKLGRVEELRARVDDAGDAGAVWQLTGLLIRQDRIGEAIDVIRPQADADHPNAARVLTDLLAQQGRLDELRERAATGDELSLWRLADLLADRGAAEELTILIDAHHSVPHFAYAVSGWLADVLADQGRLDTLRARADAGEPSAGFRLAESLIERGDLQELRTRIEAGDRPATLRMAQHLEGSGRIDQAIDVLRDRAGGDVALLCELVHLLARQGRTDEAITAARMAAGTGDGSQLDDLLVIHGHLDELRARADDGDTYAAFRLATLLEERGRTDEAIDLIRACADAGDNGARVRLADLLAEHGHIEELRVRADAGDEESANRLSHLLARQGSIDELQARAAAGDSSAAWSLVNVLVEHGRVDELKERADNGDQNAARHLIDLLTEQCRIDELQAEVDAGTHGAAERLTALRTGRDKRDD